MEPENNLAFQAVPEITPQPIEQDFNTQPQKPIERFSVATKDRVFISLILIVSCLLTVFGIWGGFNGGFAVSTILLFAVQSVYLFEKGIKGVTAYIYGLSYPLMALSFLITTNGTVKFASFVLMFLLNIVWFKLVSAKEKACDDSSLILNAIAYLFKGIFKNLPRSLISIFSNDKDKQKNTVGILIGLGVSIPVLLIVVPLLMSSDVAFSGLVENLFGNFFSSLFKIIVGIALGLFLISYCFTLKKDSENDIVTYNFKGIYNTPIITFIAVLSCCYFLYLFSQLAYFFSAFGGFLPEGYEFTVAEYARKGFFEMAVIAAINLVIILGVFALSTKKNGKLCLPLKLLCGFISLFTLLIIATAISKMVLYINSFGMTILRLGTSAFMVFLAVVFIAVLFKIFISRIKLLKTILISASAVLILLGTLNINGVVAKYNYQAYITGALNTIDIETLYELGDEGIPYIVKLAEGDYGLEFSAEFYITQELKHGKYYSIDYTNHTESVTYDTYYDSNYTCYIKAVKPSGIGSFNLSSQKAKKALAEYVEKNRNMLEMTYNIFVE